MGLLKILTAVLILLFPLGELGRINVYNEISTTVNDILVFLIVTVWLVWLILKKRFDGILKRKLAKPIFIFIFFAFLSLLFNYTSLKTPEFIISFLYLLRFVSYAGIYFIISGFDLKFKKVILILMVISGTLIVLAGFIQYFFYPNLRNLYYLGWDEHLYRLFSSFLDPNFAATIISLYLILILSILFSGLPPHPSLSLRERVRGEGFTRMTQGMFLVLISIFAFVALLLTYSRSGYLMFFTSTSLLLLILGKKKFIAILLVVLTIGIIFLPKNLGGEGVKLLRTASVISRSEYLGNAITIFRDNPILGVGFNAYRYAQHRYGFIDDSNLRTSHAGAGTDNSFLFVLATTGIVGFAFYLYLWFKILKSCHREQVLGSFGMLNQVQHDTKKESFQKAISIVILACSVGLFVNAFFINSLFYPFVMEWMWILIGLNSSTGLRLRGSDSRSSEFKENR